MILPITTQIVCRLSICLVSLQQLHFINRIRQVQCIIEGERVMDDVIDYCRRVVFLSLCDASYKGINIFIGQLNSQVHPQSTHSQFKEISDLQTSFQEVINIYLFF
ncbi:hypothetical protein FGO68_gene14096 [Halteria grandinella]|uniref:Uncharacterized protein n=1 Tax=Halteria grandinella TaxID=5974 RepID=A0A8J8NMG9_HALGN|nr:hypothetical protein FGO68_gene14096 [Halteria grandinella]